MPTAAVFNPTSRTAPIIADPARSGSGFTLDPLRTKLKQCINRVNPDSAGARQKSGLLRSPYDAAHGHDQAPS